MFIDSSVLVAILAGEPDAQEFSNRIEAATRCVTSPLVVLETTMRLSSIHRVDPVAAGETVLAFLRRAAIEQAPIEAQDGTGAITAFAAYGKGRGHKARLNIADCLSYACAKNRGLKLLYKGNDFAVTDLA